MDIIAQLNKESMDARNANIPDFAAGDTLRVHVKVVEGTRSRIQVFEGLCIARHNKNIGSSFTVRKVSFGEGVERVFPLFSPVIDKIDVVRRGKVRRAKLYYLRGLTGKAARIAEKARSMVPTSGAAESREDVAPAETPAPAAEEANNA